MKIPIPKPISVNAATWFVRSPTPIPMSKNAGIGHLSWELEDFFDFIV